MSPTVAAIFGAARAASASARSSRPGELKLTLPCSASLATIVAATPFDTDAQRNTVSGVTGRPSRRAFRHSP